MVIRLLGLLSEDEKLRSALMRFPDKLIEFLSLTINRGSILCQRNVEPDQDCSGLEVQSLTTALSLMSYLVELTFKFWLNKYFLLNWRDMFLDYE